jgi:hypothetical protein
MSISQPSPDELIYEPQHYTAIVPLKFALGSMWWMYFPLAIIYLMGGIAMIASVLSKGNPFSAIRIFATFQEFLFQNALLMTLIIIVIFTAIFGCAVLLRILQYLRSYRIAERFTLNRVGLESSGFSSGMVSIRSRDSFWKKKQLEIPFDEISNIQISYVPTLHLKSMGIELTRRSYTQPIALRNISFHSIYKDRRIASSLLSSAIAEVEAISDFLQLPQKPSYSAQRSFGVVAIGSLKKQNILKIKRGSQSLEFSIPYLAPGCREKWRFNGASNQTTVEYCFMGLKVAKGSPTVRDVLVVREFVGMNDYLLKMMVDRQPRDKYSIILIAQGITKKGIREQRYHFLTSTNLLQVQEITQELRQYLDLPSENANNAQLTHSSSLGHS